MFSKFLMSSPSAFLRFDFVGFCCCCCCFVCPFFSQTFRKISLLLNRFRMSFVFFVYSKPIDVFNSLNRVQIEAVFFFAQNWMKISFQKSRYCAWFSFPILNEYFGIFWCDEYARYAWLAFLPLIDLKFHLWW